MQVPNGNAFREVLPNKPPDKTASCCRILLKPLKTGIFMYSRAYLPYAERNRVILGLQAPHSMTGLRR